MLALTVSHSRDLMQALKDAQDQLKLDQEQLRSDQEVLRTRRQKSTHIAHDEFTHRQE